ncbi:hypothetical protein WR25_11911 [Diploscapter pachys]|uniref:Glutathionylspermidine synthase pre-ATP-grasp-like domain-containing protein n=1 Tax=Diploscapter pachys TaxID=2018661 RepID=A0A2A2K536_9BILA|nr:hypothetical protein WR25_11911 [Diploscapter pachys]
MCLDAVARIVDSEALMTRLAIAPAFFDLVRRSWKEGHAHLYGRFDFSYDADRTRRAAGPCQPVQHPG